MNRLLSAPQKSGRNFQAQEIYDKTLQFLGNRSSMVNPQLIERYAMAQARWIQCEEIVSEYGFLAKDPKTGVPIQSPYVTMAQSYLREASKLWNEIIKILNHGDTDPPWGDDLEELLSSHK